MFGRFHLFGAKDTATDPKELQDLHLVVGVGFELPRVLQ